LICHEPPSAGSTEDPEPYFDRQCTPYDERAQHVQFEIHQPKEDQDLVQWRAQQSGIRCGGAPTHQLCKKGHYCPNVLQQVKCPAGAFCREGSVEPQTCPLLTTCPAGTAAPTDNFVGLLLALLGFFITGVAYISYHYYAKWRNAKLRAAHHADGAIAEALVAPVIDPYAESNRELGAIEKIGLDRYQTIPSAVAAKEMLNEEKKRRANKFKCPFDRWYDCLCRVDVVASRLTCVFVFAFDSTAAQSLEARPLQQPPIDDTEPRTDRLTFSAYFYELSLHVGSRTVLDKASGLIQAGKVTAIMGASGSGNPPNQPTVVTSAFSNSVHFSTGKSSFLAALSGRGRAYGDIDGSLFIKASDDKAFRRGWLNDIEDYVAFVPQEDVMSRELSVEHNIRFSASYRLERGANVTAAVQRTMKSLELLGVRHEIVGDAEKRGISGGERKRVNIGMELVANPSVLLLDEPTSGLDASAAIKVMRLLKTVARHGTAVVCVVHQPRREIFGLFDELLLLARGGHVAYMGPRAGSLDFFAAHFASRPDEGQNPADFLLDMVLFCVFCGVVSDWRPSDAGWCSA
jgi:ABC-type multidrug transport system ATPase subunit